MIPSLRPILAATLAVALAFTMLACSEASTAAGARVRYSAALEGSRVRPTATGSQASGTATFDAIGSVLNYELRASEFTTPLLLAHLHLGAISDPGPVAAGLPVIAQAGIVATGRIDLGGLVTFNTLTIAGDSLRALIENGFAYVDLHTAAFPGGELRGQLVRVP